MLAVDHIVRRDEAVQYLYPRSSRPSLVNGKKLAKTPSQPVSGPDRRL
jgi:hypothetical protein